MRWHLVSSEPISSEPRRLVETSDGLKGYADVRRQPGQSGHGGLPGQSVGLHGVVYSEALSPDGVEATRRVLDREPEFA